MTLPLFEDIKGLKPQNQHPKYCYLRDEIQLNAEKELLLAYTEGFIDRDNKVVRQFQETFHSTFWEICLYQLCLEAGFSLDQSKPYPDFCIIKPFEFYIEAVVANIKQYGTPESNRTLEDILSMLSPPKNISDFQETLNESIIRDSNAIINKMNKYNNYKKASWFNSKVPYIIALSSNDQINYGREYIYSMLALLYGRYYIAEYGCCAQAGSITKPETGKDIPLGLFLDDKYKHVSAIIFTCTNTIGKLTALALSSGKITYNKVIEIIQNYEDFETPYKYRIIDENNGERVSDGVFIFHNPFASNPIKPDLFKNTNVTHFVFENNELHVLGVTTPIVSRYSTSSIIIDNLPKESILQIMSSWY